MVADSRPQVARDLMVSDALKAYRHSRTVNATHSTISERFGKLMKSYICPFDFNTYRVVDEIRWCRYLNCECIAQLGTLMEWKIDRTVQLIPPTSTTTRMLKVSSNRSSLSFNYINILTLLNVYNIIIFHFLFLIISSLFLLNILLI